MEKKKKSTLFTRLFGNRNKVTDFMTEEQLQSPGRLILKNFLHNRLGMIGLIVFLLIFLLVMIGPKFYTLDLSYQDNTQLNVPPGMNMMSIPDGMKHKVADISPGTTYGVGVDTDGNVYTWGYTKITETIDLKNIPEVYVNGDLKHRVPTNLNISFAYIEGESLMMALKDIAVSSGSACTSASLEPSYVLRAIGRNDELAHSSIRFTLGRFTTEEDIDFTVKLLTEKVAKLRELSPLWEMHKEGIDLAEVKWSAH